ncbi:non-homologous end joining protein Ku [Persicimonas caeni]|uniref:non-homologous end joining protein Ku n=1 Tax=Persicimonas caeni TaxID=2292766 RepID=UPI00143D7733|nr:Ku protein [Persicimonas caeni]
MPKVIWKGHINFGLVNVPVRLYSATRKRKLDFHLIDKRDQSPVGYLKINKDTGREVRPEEVARAIEVDGEKVVVEDDDFEQAEAHTAQNIDIQHFVRREQINPAFFEKPYYLAPMEGAEKSYTLLREVIERTGRVGIAKVVLRKREHLAALMVQDNVVVLEMLRFADELRDPSELDLPAESAGDLGVTTDALEMATELVQRMTRDWKPDQYRDEYREELLELIEDKARRARAGTAEPSSQPEESRPTSGEPGTTEGADLTERLRQSIERGGGSLA